MLKAAFVWKKGFIVTRILDPFPNNSHYSWSLCFQALLYAAQAQQVLMTIITACSASVVVGSNSRGGVEIPESMCSGVGGIILQRTYRLEWTPKQKSSLSRHTALPPESLKLNVLFICRANKRERPQSQQVFRFKLKPRGNREFGGGGGFGRRCGFYVLYMLPVVMSALPQQVLQIYSMRSWRHSVRFSDIREEKSAVSGSAALMDLPT